MTTTELRRRPSRSELDWRESSSCRDQPLELFFPSGFSVEARDAARTAKGICGSCPVRERCLEFALATLQDHGIWGGLDEEERRVVRRRRRALARAATAPARADRPA